MNYKITKPIMGCHNSMTAYAPRTIFGYIGNIFAKCQTKTIDELVEDYQVFDIRVCFDKQGDLEYRHGLVRYDGVGIYTVMNILSHYKDKKQFFVRLLLEKWDNDYDVIKFQNLCATLTLHYPDIIFIGGNRKGDWKKCYDFNNGITDADVYQWVSSMADDARWYEKICPFLYAKRMNKKNVEKAKTINGIHLFDFV